MMRAEHQAALEGLMADLDGELTPAESAAVQAHVAGCRDCQEVEAELRGVTERLATWTIAEPPVSLKSPVPASPVALMERIRSWLPIAALLVFAVGAGMIWLPKQRQHGAQEASTVTAVPAADAPQLAYPARALE